MYEQALSTLNQQQQNGEPDQRIMMQRVQIYRELGDYTQALRACEEALEQA